MPTRAQAPIERLDVSAYTVPTDRHESDGTLEWDSTTIVVVEMQAAGKHGLGYTYADTSTASLVRTKLAACVVGRDAMQIPAAWMAMRRDVRNLGCRGIAAMAISAVDNALWDLKAKLLDMPLLALLGAVRDEIPAYGSGGFTSYSLDELRVQLGRWASDGFRYVKMKVGRDQAFDVERVRAAREAIGADVSLFVDANGGYSVQQALAQARPFASFDVDWFEEPVSSDDLVGLAEMRTKVPPGMRIAAGEYGYTPAYFQRMLAARAVDVLQADATRCCGLSGFLAAGALCEAWARPLSAHCAPSLHVHACCALPAAWNLEYFHDHVRIEHLLFDGAPIARGGLLRPDMSRPGVGLELKRPVAARYTV